MRRPNRTERATIDLIFGADSPALDTFGMGKRGSIKNRCNQPDPSFDVTCKLANGHRGMHRSPEGWF